MTEQNAKLQKLVTTILDYVPSGVIAVDTDGMIMLINREACHVLDLSLDTSIGTKISVFNGLQAFWHKMRNAMEQNEAIERDEVIVNLDKEIPIGFSVSPLQKDDRGISGCVSIFRDLSEIKALQEKMKQIEKLSYLGKMASWMAHEIRNPLASIDGFAQLLVDTQKPEKIRLFSTEILKGARRIDNIIEDTLAFAKTSRKKPTLVPIDLRELVNAYAVCSSIC
jgi:PAS domain S-box-containing protein